MGLPLEQGEGLARVVNYILFYLLNIATCTFLSNFQKYPIPQTAETLCEKSRFAFQFKIGIFFNLEPIQGQRIPFTASGISLNKSPIKPICSSLSPATRRLFFQVRARFLKEV